MTRILAFSDIHNNVNAVRKLRSREANDYDALIVAGDIGSYTANEIFDVLRTFECPVLYVYGNWDHGLNYLQDFGSECHHIHLTPFEIGGLNIVGETIDGIDHKWEAIRARIKPTRLDDLDKARKLYMTRQREELSKIVAARAHLPTILVTHYRLTKTRHDLSSVPLFLFGHNHGFKDTHFVGQRFVNVSALENKVTVVRRGINRIGHNDYHFLNDGGYVVITHQRGKDFHIESRRFNPDFSEWTRIEREYFSWAKEVQQE